MKKYLFLDRGLFNGRYMTNAKVELASIQKEGTVFFREDFFADPPRKWEVCLLYTSGKGLIHKAFQAFGNVLAFTGKTGLGIIRPQHDDQEIHRLMGHQTGKNVRQTA